MTDTRLTPEEYKHHCITAIKGAQIGLEVALEALDGKCYPTMLDALHDAENSTHAAALLASMFVRGQK